MEKKQLESEYMANQEAINGYNNELKDLKEELENMKNVIAHTFEEELRSAPNINNQSKISRR
jgi:hypothetical protein